MRGHTNALFEQHWSQMASRVFMILCGMPELRIDNATQPSNATVNLQVLVHRPHIPFVDIPINMVDLGRLLSHAGTFFVDVKSHWK